MKRIRTSAPGKTILIGEHSAVYGRPALLAAIDRRAYVDLAAASRASVRLDLPQLDIAEEIAWVTILEETRRCRDAWEAFDGDPSPEAFRKVGVQGDPAHLVKIALGEAALYLEEKIPEAIELRVDARLPVGAGFGSSAAVASAIVAAYLRLRGREASKEQLHALSLEAERRQHGRPSGVDNAAVLHGGLLRISRVDDALQIEPLNIKSRNTLLEHFHVFHTGAPAESTGQVVAQARRRIEERPAFFQRVLDRMEEGVEALSCELTVDEPQLDRSVEIVRDFSACLEELGVVPPRVQAAIRDVERAGGAAKISGAGSLSDPGAGALLVLHPCPDRLKEIASLRDFERLDLKLGAPGLSYERFSGLPRCQENRLTT